MRRRGFILSVVAVRAAGLVLVVPATRPSRRVVALRPPPSGAFFQTNFTQSKVTLMLVDNFAAQVALLATDKNCTFTIRHPSGLTITGPASLLPGLVTELTGGPVDRPLSAAPVLIAIPPERIGFSYKASAAPEQAN